MGRNLSYQDKRTILIVVGSLLLVLCLLMLPRFCTSHQRKPLPIPPDPPIPVQDSNPQTKSPADTLQITDSVFYTSQNTDNGSTNNRIVTKNDNLNGSDNDDTYWNDNLGDDGDVIDVGEVVGPIDTLMSEEQYGNDPIQDDNQSNGINEVATEKGNLSNTNSKSNSDSDENSPNNFDDDDDYYNDTRNEDDSDHNNFPTQSDHSPHERVGSQNMGIVALIILIVLLICYIIARIKSKNGTLVITANTIDKILIILSPILFFIVWCIGFDHEMFPVQTMLLILSGIMLVISIIFSIIANSGNLFNIIVSIMAKLFIFVFTNILLLLLIVIFFISIMRTILNHNNSEETYIVKYDHFLDQWVGYRVN